MKKYLFFIALIATGCFGLKQQPVSSHTCYFSLDGTESICIEADSAFRYGTTGHFSTTLCYGNLVAKNDSIYLRNAQKRSELDSNGVYRVFTLTQCDSIEPLVFKKDTLIFREKKFVGYKSGKRKG